MEALQKELQDAGQELERASAYQEAINEEAQSLNEEGGSDYECRQQPRLPGARDDSARSADRAGRQGDQHGRRVQDHHGSRNIVAGHAPRVPGDHVEPPISDTELLSKVTAEPLAPHVDTRGSATERQPVACLVQAVAQIVVVAVSKALVEKPNLMQRTRAIGGIPRAHVIDEASLNS